MSSVAAAFPDTATKLLRASAWPLVLYGMTGFTGLLAEQGLEKYITLLVGATVSASAVVIFTYFLGFAVGGLAGAQMLKRGLIRRPLRTYAALEFIVGISCVAFSYSFHPVIALLAPLQNLVAGEWEKQIVRFGCGCLLVLPIAAIMGASFPLIAQALDNGDFRGPQRWSLAYSANLTGAVLASLLAPYFVLPAVGLRGAMWICFVICTSVAAIVQSRPEPADRVTHHANDLAAHSPGLDRDTSLLLAAAFLSGAIFFALEVLWTHLIGAVIGGSVYAFSAMLATVLSGLLIGSWLVNLGREIRTSVLMQVCAITLVVQLWVWDIAPAMFLIAGPSIYRNFFPRELYRLFISILLILPAATALGMIYPRLLRSPLTRRDGNAWLAGYLSGANSLGCLLGALAATFVLVPALGSEASLKLVILALATLALIFRFREADTGASPRAVAVLALVMILVATLPRHWEWTGLTSGASMYFGENTFNSTAPPSQVIRSIIFRDENIQGGFTTVVEQRSSGNQFIPPTRYMYSDGKLQGDDDPDGEYPTQFGMGATACLYNARFNRALLIGLGSGQAARVLKDAGFNELDIAEFSPGVINAAEAGFSHINRRVWHDPGVHMIVEDGRNVLLTNPTRRYDLITVELTAIWFSGATNLFSREFYELARAHLEPDGVFQQWLQFHRIGPNEIASVLATLRCVFPYVSYHIYGEAGMVIAANHPFTATSERIDYLAERLHQGAQLSTERARSVIHELSRSEVLSPAGADALIAATRPVINTDHNRHIEYATPKYSSSERDWRTYNIRYLSSWNR